MSLDGDTGIQLIREVLEGMLEPLVASAVIFEALAADRANELPSSGVDLLVFTRGPLRAAVERRMGSQTAADAVQGVERLVQRFVSEPPPDRVGATVEVPVGHGPVRVLIVSSHATLAIALRAALGGEAVGVGSASSVEHATTLLHRLDPALLIVDGLAPVEGDAGQLALLLADAASACTVLVWGPEEPWGQEVAAGLDARSAVYTPVDQREGVDPLLDFVRSRHQAG